MIDVRIRPAPRLSVVIPTYNRCGLLAVALAALGRQTEPADQFEVIVVVDGSTDETRQMLSRVEVPYRLRVLVQPNRGAGSARNTGLAEAGGDYCVFLDDDIVAGPGLVRAHLRLQGERPGVVGLGPVVTTPLRTTHGFVGHSAREWTRRAGHNPRPTFLDCWGANLSVPRAALTAVGGFAADLRYGEDVELGYRLHNHGFSFAWVREAQASQLYDKDFRGLALDSEHKGAAAVELTRRHAAFRAVLPIGAFNRSRRLAWLRRVTLPLRPAIGLLRILDRLIDHLPETGRWYGYRLLDDHLYWRGVRRAVESREAWHGLTRRVAGGARARAAPPMSRPRPSTSTPAS